jgi:ADP-dependent NAD(P)H-hydrate dehydratase
MSPTAPSPRAEIVVDDGVLARYPLPTQLSATTKQQRGTVVVVGSSRETIGATLLAGTAALRCGAGKLRMIVDRDVATPLAVAVPEGRVVGVPVVTDTVDTSTFDVCAEVLQSADAVLVGPGALNGEQGRALVAAVAPHLGTGTAFVLDASALAVFDSGSGVGTHLRDRTIAIPNVAEAAHVLGIEVGAVAKAPREALDDLVTRLAVCVALRQDVTWIGTPDGERFIDHTGHPALATSGSGDVLAGMLAGLAARGAPPLIATLWAVHAHGLAGERLARDFGGVGLIARDLVDSIPTILNGLGGQG